MSRNVLPNRRECETLRLNRGSRGYAVSIGRFGDGRAAEIFVSSDHAENGEQCVLRDAAVIISIALQYGVPVETLRHAVARLSDNRPASLIGDVLDLLGDEGGAAAVARPDPIAPGPDMGELLPCP
jgi:ribonucleoside-diphosphate reductase alpha chain